MAVTVEQLPFAERVSDLAAKKLLYARFALTMSKKALSTPEGAEELMESVRYAQPPFDGKDVKKPENLVSSRPLGAGTAVTFTPRWVSCKKHILFFPGSGFIFPPMPEHFRFVDSLASLLRCEITVFAYPLTPTYTYADTYAPAAELYRSLAEKYGGENIVLMGDSAGGTIAMELCSFFKKAGLPAPGGLVCFSPLCDLRLDNPDIALYEKNDHMLGAAGQRRLCESWCGARSLDDPLLNPMCMDFSDLPETLVICSDEDLLYPDVRLFVSRAYGKAKKLDVRLYEGLFHSFVLFPLKSSERVKHTVAEFLGAAE